MFGLLAPSQCRRCNASSVERNKWGHGPWDDEPDFKLFEHNGLLCQLHREEGNWLGYVAVTKESKYFQVAAEDIRIQQLASGLQGSVVWSFWLAGHFLTDTELRRQKFWWFGLNFAHIYQVHAPNYRYFNKDIINRWPMAGYWGIGDAEQQLKLLAERLAK